MRYLFLIFAIMFAGACATTDGRLNYKKHKIYSGDSAGNNQFEEVGPVESGKWGFAWKSCDQMVDDVVADMKRKAKGMGGDSVVEVKFLEGDYWVKRPTCKKNWVFLYSWTEARGTVVKLAH